MALLKISDFDPDYREAFDGNDVKGMSVYAQGSDEKIGTVSDVLVDEEGNFRYFIVDLGFWIFGKKVLMPVGRSRIDYGADRVYAVGMTREQAENLPEFDENMAVDYDYEERVRGVYRGQTATAEIPLEGAPLDTAATVGMATPAPRPTYTRDTYDYKYDEDLYNLKEDANQNLKLYQERLVANKVRRKAGEVSIGKRVETETAQVSIPIEKERVVIERVSPTDAGRAVDPSQVRFGEGETTRVELYEETPEVRKEAFVREEVRVRKEVDQETVQAQETIRREELEIHNEGTVIENQDRLPNDRI
ncbi:DUF2382 domain-containing protein [Gloeocapsa sp. BRSZ]